MLVYTSSENLNVVLSRCVAHQSLYPDETNLCAFSNCLVRKEFYVEQTAPIKEMSADTRRLTRR